ncbi:MAG: N-acetylmuramoyl-L-alanine amidase [Planctomycetes bacterium]|nr:N-acetylmuramoyl-L-alanine amidase [Planctomycetota bacterium]
MRHLILGFVLLSCFLAGCTTIGTIPPQQVSAENPEPRTIMLSEMCADLGWDFDSGPGAYDYVAVSPKGDRVVFRIGSDIVIVNDSKWRQERDTVEKGGCDLLLPESTFNFVARHFGRHDKVRNTATTSTGSYVLEPLAPAGEPAVKPEPKAKVPASNKLRGLHVCIDAGHGGKDPGGCANGVQEKGICLAVALMLRDLCEDAGATVLMTRTEDTYPELQQRVDMANKAKCDLFVSIHANIAPEDDAVTGFEAFFNPDSEASGRLAGALVAAMDKATDATNRGAKKDPRELRVLEQTRMPATLVELGFMSNAGEAKRLVDKGYQQRMAKALFDGLVNHYSRMKASVSR